MIAVLICMRKEVWKGITGRTFLSGKNKFDKPTGDVFFVESYP